jgi:hypothetical protein
MVNALMWLILDKNKSKLDMRFYNRNNKYSHYTQVVHNHHFTVHKACEYVDFPWLFEKLRQGWFYPSRI